MSCLSADKRFDAMVRESVVNYGQYTVETLGLGHGLVDWVLEVDVVPFEVWDGHDQCMFVGCYGEDLDIGTFFRTIGLDVSTGDTYVAIPSKAFAGDDDEVHYTHNFFVFIIIDNRELKRSSSLSFYWH